MTSTSTLPAESPDDHQNIPQNPACLGMYQSILKPLNPAPSKLKGAYASGSHVPFCPPLSGDAFA